MARRFRDIDLIGVDDLIARLRGLDDKLHNKVSRAALRYAAGPMITAAKINAKSSERTGQLRKSIGLKVGFSRRKKIWYVQIGPRYGFEVEREVYSEELGRNVKVRINPVNYAHLVEYGTKPHWLGKGQNTRKRTRSALLRALGGGGGMHKGAEAKAYLRPAYDAKNGLFEKRLSEKLMQLLEKYG